jgi:hypothetical protein
MKVRRAASRPLTAAVRSQLEFGWAADVNPRDHGDPKRLSYASDLMLLQAKYDARPATISAQQTSKWSCRQNKAIVANIYERGMIFRCSSD